MTDRPPARVNEHGQPIGVPLPGWTPRQPPAPVTLTGRLSAVVPLGSQHVDDLYDALGGEATDSYWTYMSYGPFRSRESFRAFVEQTDDASTVRFALVGPDGRAAGMASYARIEPAIGSVEVGGIMYAPSLQRTPSATELMYLMARHVFDDLGYRRYEWKCDALNEGSRAAALRLGFRFEGVWRKAMIYKGRNRDTAWFAMTDEDWPAARAAFEAWLDPANFDRAGGQLQRLEELRFTG